MSTAGYQGPSQYRPQAPAITDSGTTGSHDWEPGVKTLLAITATFGGAIIALSLYIWQDTKSTINETQKDLKELTKIVISDHSKLEYVASDLKSAQVDIKELLRQQGIQQGGVDAIKSDIDEIKKTLQEGKHR